MDWPADPGRGRSLPGPAATGGLCWCRPHSFPEPAQATSQAQLGPHHSRPSTFAIVPNGPRSPISPAHSISQPRPVPTPIQIIDFMQLPVAQRLPWLRASFATARLPAPKAPPFRFLRTRLCPQTLPEVSTAPALINLRAPSPTKTFARPGSRHCRVAQPARARSSARRPSRSGRRLGRCLRRRFGQGGLGGPGSAGAGSRCPGLQAGRAGTPPD